MSWVFDITKSVISMLLNLATTGCCGLEDFPKRWLTYFMEEVPVASSQAKMAILY